MSSISFCNLQRRTFCLFFILFCAILFTGCTSTSAPQRRKALLDNNAYNRKYKLAGPMPVVKYITIHNTANKGPASAERNYLNNRRDMKYISFHYAVDENEIIQIMPHNVHAWHAGDGRGPGNMQSIAIEICRSTHPDQSLYKQAEENAVILAASLLKEFHLSPNRLRMHWHWNGKHCPHRILDSNSWASFQKRVRLKMLEQPE